MQYRAVCVLTLTLLGAAGCASPEYVARSSNYDVCRLSMGGPHAQAADAEAARRGLNCQSMYGAISAQEAQRARANQDLVNALRPPPQPLLIPPQVNCTSYRTGSTVQTTCH